MLRTEKAPYTVTVTIRVQVPPPSQRPPVWTVVESAVEDIVDGADGNRRLGRHGDGLACDVTAVSLAW